MLGLGEVALGVGELDDGVGEREGESTPSFQIGWLDVFVAIGGAEQNQPKGAYTG